jgi:hypothetical protein
MASITNRIKIDMVEIHLYPDTLVCGKNLLNKRSLIDPNKFKIQIVSPFESGYLDECEL